MSDEKKDKASTSAEKKDDGVEPAAGQKGPETAESGPKFTQAPDPLAGVKKSASDVMHSMEGKTVSMKVYVGTIIGVVVLMMLARCGG